MKQVDFTKPGGIPLTQDLLDFLQEGSMESVNAIAAMGDGGVANTAYVLKGMESSTAGGTVTVSAGWFLYNGELIRFPQDTYSTPVAGGNAIYVDIVRTSLPLSYKDGSIPNVKIDVTGELAAMVNSTPTDATRFKLADIEHWDVAGQWTNTGIVFANTPGVNEWSNWGAPYGDLMYRVTKNKVELAGVIEGAPFAAPFSPCFTLPVAVRPSVDIILPVWSAVGMGLGGYPGVYTITVQPTGVVSLSAPVTHSGPLYLDGVSFRIDK